MILNPSPRGAVAAARALCPGAAVKWTGNHPSGSIFIGRVSFNDACRVSVALGGNSSPIGTEDNPYHDPQNGEGFYISTGVK